jgi:hypothetical protein
MMDWWNDFVDWFYSDEGWKIISGAIIPFVAILVAGIIAALIGRGATKRLVEQRVRETRAAAVAALVAAGRDAARWHSQSPTGRDHSERLAADADVTVRLMPIAGSALAADWAAHQLADMRINSVSFSFQAEQTLAEYRDRLVRWVEKPGKARKLFAADLERWQYENATVDPVVVEQQKWAEEQYTAQTHEAPDHAPDVPLPSEPGTEAGLNPQPLPPQPTERFETAAAAAPTASSPTTGAVDTGAPAVPPPTSARRPSSGPVVPPTREDSQV